MRHYSSLVPLALVLSSILVSDAELKAEESLRVLDVQRVRADEPASSAVLVLVPPANPPIENCDVLIVGDGTGGTSAALAAAEGGMRVCVTGETAWVGGQMTAQGVSAFDENRYIETAGGTASYYRLRNDIRRFYLDNYTLSPAGKAARYFNPGNCWVSALCFQPTAALQVLTSMLQPHRQRGLFRVFPRTKAVSAKVTDNRIESVLTYGFDTGRWVRFHAQYVIDATDTGDLLPLTGAEYVTGAESRSLTGEPDARAGAADPNDSQSFTYTFVLARSLRKEGVISEPSDYAKNLRDQPYTLTVDYGKGKLLTYGMFTKTPGTPGSFWSYRRLIAAENFSGAQAPNEMSMINWPGNDYCGPALLSIDPTQQSEQLRQAKLLSLGFVYWLQHDAPRDANGKGYPELRLLTSELGSMDGLSQFPYIRESRRIRAIETIREQDIAAVHQKGPRSRWFPDSVGIGFYSIDIHSCSKMDFSSGTKPFQLPLGALIPVKIQNLLAASKNTGTTHITNGAYRLHPIEWAVGEAAGRLAVLAVKSSQTPREILADAQLTSNLQLELVSHGAPIFWFDDLKVGDPAFPAAQFLAGKGIFGGNDRDLHFSPTDAATRQDALIALARLVRIEQPPATNLWSARLADAALHEVISAGYWPASEATAAELERQLLFSDLKNAVGKTGIGLPEGSKESGTVNRSSFAIWLMQVYLARHKDFAR